ncbi:hypothetical protein ACFE04_009020 [Oxalis oulophora]
MNESDSSSGHAHTRRTSLYENMAHDLDHHGPAFLNHGLTSQSLSLSNLFSLNHHSLMPTHKPAIPPVRANVLYMNPHFSLPISLSTNSLLPTSITNSTLYHFSMFHASHHITPVPANQAQIEAEATAVKLVAQALCPLKIVLDRVVLTSTGVLLGCWQVVSGTDPITIRAKLRRALPLAPEKQLYDAAILHTSFARLLGGPTTSAREFHSISDQLQFFHELVDQLNEKLHGYEATVHELWYVEEYDLLALAVDGRMKVRRFQLGC